MSLSGDEDGTPLLGALVAAGERPHDRALQGEKKNYAQRLSAALALEVARRLRPQFPRITPTGASDQERPIGTAEGTKRVDVCVWDNRFGLMLDVSIKTLSFRDYDRKNDIVHKRIQKNVVRNDHELRAEASRMHERQPFALLVALMFVPYFGCQDGEDGKSSFAHMVMTYRKRAGRLGHDDLRHDRFEAFYIGLYEHEGDRRGHVRFFDVMKIPPRNGRPKRADTISFEELTQEIKRLVDKRNSKATEWAEPEGDE